MLLFGASAVTAEDSPGRPSMVPDDLGSPLSMDAGSLQKGLALVEYTWEWGPQDADCDWVDDLRDNCVMHENQNQADADDDGVGDKCDLCAGTEIGALVDADGCEVVFGTLIAAASRRTHGGQGTFDLPIPLDGVLIEPRDNSGAPRIVLTFDTPPADPGCAGVTLINGTCHDTSTSGNDLIIEMTFHAHACVELTVGEETVRVLAHTGDVDGNGAVNILDLQAVKNHILQPVNATNVRCKVRSEGNLINILDMVAVRNNMFIPAVCP